MDPETGKAIVIAITAVGALAWLAGVTIMLRATRERRARSQEAADRFDIEGPAAEGTIVGEAEVEGAPEDLSVKLAEQLARDGMGPFGPIKIVARDRREVAFEAAGPSLGPSGAPGSGFRRGRIRLTPSGSRTRVEYALETSSGQAQLVIGWLFIALGLVALVVGYWLELAYVLPSPNPNIRGQSVQMVQVVHLLWPPFLFAHLSRQPARFLRARIEALVHNLPYT